MIHDLPRTFVLTVKASQDRHTETMAHLQRQGINAELFFAFDKFTWACIPDYTFDVNKVGERLGWGQCVICLSHYMLWKVMLHLPGDSFWALEDDVEFIDDWRQQYTIAMKHLPEDWDVVFLGSCCAQSRRKWRKGGNVYEIRYPLCGHAMMYRKKALPVLLDIHQKIWAPLDISMQMDSLPRLRTYTILPRIATQRGSFTQP